MPPPPQPADPPLLRQLTDAGVASFTDEGQGRPLVCIPGIPGGARDFRWLAPALTAGARIIRLELPGFGACPPGRTPPTVGGFGAYIADVVRALDLGPVALLGHSYGAMAAAAAAHRLGPLAAGVALINPIGLSPHQGYRALGMPGLWHRAWRSPLAAPLARPLIARIFRQAGFRDPSPAHIERALAAMGALRFPEHTTLVSSLPGPTLVALADDDPLVEPAVSLALSAACPPGPRLRFRFGGHRLQKVEALALGAALLRWLGDLRWPPAAPPRAP